MAELSCNMSKLQMNCSKNARFAYEAGVSAYFKDGALTSFSIYMPPAIPELDRPASSLSYQFIPYRTGKSAAVP